MIIQSLLLFLIALFVLVVSGGWLIKLLVKLSNRIGLSEFLIAFIIMAFATSIPELFVGINSALNNNTSLAIGNVIGANIANLTLVIGISVLISKGVKSKSKYMKKDLILMFLFALAPLVLLLIGRELSRIDGVILLLLFFGYMYYLIKNKRKVGRIKFGGFNGLVVLILLFAACITLLFISANYVVKHAQILSVELALPTMIIGLFLISLGTTLPELVVGIRAGLQKKGDLVIGDSMGSVVANSTLILGITSIIRPITDNFILFLISGIYMLLVIIFFSIMLLKQKGFSVTSALILLFMYILFIIFGIGFNSF